MLWPVYILNHMSPSGGSIVHPHAQVLVESEPLPVQQVVMKRSRDYFARIGREYWNHLLASERALGDRFVYENEYLGVVASYAPRGFNELQFVFKHVDCLAGLDGSGVLSFVDCLSRALREYQELGVGSFNLVSFSGPMGGVGEHWRLTMKLISRPYPGLASANDTGPFERLCNAWVIDTVPETLASRVRALFR